MSSSSSSKNLISQGTDPKAFARYDADVFTLIPCHHWDAVNDKGKPIGKAPTAFDWTKRPYNTDKVRKAAIASGRNLGVRLDDETLVIDVDPRNGGDAGFESMAFDVGLDPDKWPRVWTGSGGFHCYLRKPADVLTRDTLEKYPGVEFKSRGRQVVAAGSKHPNGKRYRWSKDHPRIEDGLPMIPTALLNLIKRPRNTMATGGGIYDQAKTAKLLSYLDPLDFKDQSKWFALMQAVHHGSNGDARHEFIEWSTQDSDYADQADVIGRRWDSLDADRDDGVTVATFHMHLRKAGAAAAIRPDAARVADDFDDGDDMTFEPDDAAADMTFEADDAADVSFEADDDDPTKPMEVLGRGLKVNNASVASDSFKNAFSAVMNSGLTVAFNELSKTVEFIGDVPWDVRKFGRVLDDKVLAMVRLFVIGKYQGNDFDPNPKHLSDATHALAYSNRFNPIDDYLAAVQPTWDGVARVERLFGEFFNCGVDNYTRGVSKAFMVGAVRRIRLPGSKFDTLPVLKSPQGWNKSTALRTLFGDRYYSDSNLGPLSNKDAAMKLRGLWVCEFAEIESLRKHEVNVLKAFVSQLSDRQRDPYERLPADVPRSNVFAATVNEGGYLGDATGGRRFWPLEVSKPIDVAKLKATRDQLWAEAATMESNGESSVLPAKLWAAAALRQDAETIEDPWEDALRSYLDRRAAGDVGGPSDDDDDFDAVTALPADRVQTGELFDVLQIPVKDQTRVQTMRLRSVMVSRLGWKHKKAVRIGETNLAGYARE